MKKFICIEISCVNEVKGMEFQDYVETLRGFTKMGFATGKTTLELVKVGLESYSNMYSVYMRQFLPSESFESIKKAMDIHIESQTKVLDNFKKLVEQFEKQQEELFSRLSEVVKNPEKKKG